MQLFRFLSKTLLLSLILGPCSSFINAAEEEASAGTATTPPLQFKCLKDAENFYFAGLRYKTDPQTKESLDQLKAEYIKASDAYLAENLKDFKFVHHRELGFSDTDLAISCSRTSSFNAFLTKAITGIVAKFKEKRTAALAELTLEVVNKNPREKSDPQFKAFEKARENLLTHGTYNAAQTNQNTIFFVAHFLKEKTGILQTYSEEQRSRRQTFNALQEQYSSLHQCLSEQTTKLEQATSQVAAKTLIVAGKETIAQINQVGGKLRAIHTAVTKDKEVVDQFIYWYQLLKDKIFEQPFDEKSKLCAYIIPFFYQAPAAGRPKPDDIFRFFAAESPLLDNAGFAEQILIASNVGDAWKSPYNPANLVRQARKEDWNEAVSAATTTYPSLRPPPSAFLARPPASIQAEAPDSAAGSHLSADAADSTTLPRPARPTPGTETPAAGAAASQSSTPNPQTLRTAEDLAFQKLILCFHCKDKDQDQPPIDYGSLKTAYTAASDAFLESQATLLTPEQITQFKAQRTEALEALAAPQPSKAATGPNPAPSPTWQSFATARQDLFFKQPDKDLGSVSDSSLIHMPPTPLPTINSSIWQNHRRKIIGGGTAAAVLILVAAGGGVIYKLQANYKRWRKTHRRGSFWQFIGLAKAKAKRSTRTKRPATASDRRAKRPSR